MLLLSLKGVGQVTFTSSTSTICAGDNSYTIRFQNTVNTQLFFYIEYSNKGQNSWTTVVTTQTLNLSNSYTFASSPLIFTSKDFRVKYSTSTDSEGNLVAPTTSSLITIDVNPNTSISTQPTGYSVCAGGSSTALSVVATGTGTITYQWYSNVGFSSNAQDIVNLLNGTYYCIISDNIGNTQSTGDIVINCP